MASKPQKPPIAKKKQFLRSLKFRQSARGASAAASRPRDVKRAALRRSRSDVGDYERDDVTVMTTSMYDHHRDASASLAHAHAIPAKPVHVSSTTSNSSSGSHGFMRCYLSADGRSAEISGEPRMSSSSSGGGGGRRDHERAAREPRSCGDKQTALAAARNRHLSAAAAAAVDAEPAAASSSSVSAPHSGVERSQAAGKHATTPPLNVGRTAQKQRPNRHQERDVTCSASSQRDKTVAHARDENKVLATKEFQNGLKSILFWHVIGSYQNLHRIATASTAAERHQANDAVESSKCDLDLELAQGQSRSLKTRQLLV